MSQRHYDVIVLGRSIGALSTAALLARRDFRVLVLGQRLEHATYSHDGYALQRSAFSFLSATSPCWKRILAELAQTQTFARRTQALDPMFSVLSSERRVEVRPDIDAFSMEIDREYPEVRQVVDELYGNIANANAAADRLFERDWVYPPGSFWERLSAKRAINELPFVHSDSIEDILGKFPPGHPYLDVAVVPALFATDLATAPLALPPFALARLHGAWTRGVLSLPGGEQELVDFLVERITANGGICQLDRSAERITLRRGVLAGVVEDGEEETTGADRIVTDLSGENLAELSCGEGLSRRAQKNWPKLSVGGGRFCVNFVVRRAGLPEQLPQESFFLPDGGHHPGPRRPVLHVQRHDYSDTHSLLVAETLLPAHGPLTLLEARSAVRDAVQAQLPFLEEHLHFVDSAHDGLPLDDYSTGEHRAIERVHLPSCPTAAVSMPELWEVQPAGLSGLGGEPVRGPIPNTYLVGKTVLPALGQEGELIAAWSAAKLITRRDGARQNMRRQLFAEIETN